MDLEEGLAVGRSRYRSYLTELVGLVLLDLSWTRVGDAGVARLSALRGLRTLALAGTLLTDVRLQSLAALPGLADLDISDTHVTDAGLRAVGMLESLESLNLGGTEIHDAGLVHLGELQQLRRLYLGHTQVTDRKRPAPTRCQRCLLCGSGSLFKVAQEGMRGLQEAGGGLPLRDHREVDKEVEMPMLRDGQEVQTVVTASSVRSRLLSEGADRARSIVHASMVRSWRSSGISRCRRRPERRSALEVLAGERAADRQVSLADGVD